MLMLSAGCATIQWDDGEIDIEKTANVIEMSMQLATSEALNGIEHEATKTKVIELLARISTGGCDAFGDNGLTLDEAKVQFAAVVGATL